MSCAFFQQGMPVQVDKTSLWDKIQSAQKPKWRNWQTRYVQGVVRVPSCGFKSHLRHQDKRDSLKSEFFVIAPLGSLREVCLQSTPNSPKHRSTECFPVANWG